MNPIFHTIKANKRSTFEDPWQVLLQRGSAIRVSVPSPNDHQMMADIMSQSLVVLGKQESGSKVNVKTVCDLVVTDLTAFCSCGVPHVEGVRSWTLAAIKLLANLGYVKLRGDGNFDDKEFVVYHACAQLTFEDGQYKQQRLVKIFQDHNVFATTH